MSRGKLTTVALRVVLRDVQEHRDVVEVAGLVSVAEAAALALAAVAADEEQVDAAVDGADLRDRRPRRLVVRERDAGLHARGEVPGGDRRRRTRRSRARRRARRRANLERRVPRRVDLLSADRAGQSSGSSRTGGSGGEGLRSLDVPLDGRMRRQRAGGGRGIRTHETFLPTSFQDWLHRPLGQPSCSFRRSPSRGRRLKRTRLDSSRSRVSSPDDLRRLWTAPEAPDRSVGLRSVRQDPGSEARATGEAVVVRPMPVTSRRGVHDLVGRLAHRDGRGPRAGPAGTCRCRCGRRRRRPPARAGCRAARAPARAPVALFTPSGAMSSQAVQPIA